MAGYDKSTFFSSLTIALQVAIFSTISFIGGGVCNCAFGTYSSIVGGFNNRINDLCSIIGGGTNNTICSRYSGILTGNNNLLIGFCSFIGAGSVNSMNADGSTVTGRFNSVSHEKVSNFNYTWESFANYNFKRKFHEFTRGKSGGSNGIS